jgi:hypothetical protein
MQSRGNDESLHRKPLHTNNSLDERKGEGKRAAKTSRYLTPYTPYPQSPSRVVGPSDVGSETTRPETRDPRPPAPRLLPHRHLELP